MRLLRGKVLAAFLKAVGFIVPLMDAEYAAYYTREVMAILVREFATPDEEMKKIVLKASEGEGVRVGGGRRALGRAARLGTPPSAQPHPTLPRPPLPRQTPPLPPPQNPSSQVVKQCVGTDGVDAAYVRAEVLPDFFRCFWVRRMALDRRNYKALVETTVELAAKAGVSDVVSRIVDDLKDESEPYRRMVMETIDKVVSSLGAADVDARLEELLVDGVLYAFQEAGAEDSAPILNGFGTVVNALQLRAKPYLPQICGTIKWRLNNKSASVRQQAADLIGRLAVTMHACGEERLLGHLGVVLYEYPGEEYPEARETGGKGKGWVGWAGGGFAPSCARTLRLPPASAAPPHPLPCPRLRPPTHPPPYAHPPTLSPFAGAGVHPGGAEGDCVSRRNDAHDAPRQGPAAPPDPHPQESA